RIGSSSSLGSKSGPFRKELFYEASTRTNRASCAASRVALRLWWRRFKPDLADRTAVVSCRDVARNDDDSAEPHRATTSNASHRTGDLYVRGRAADESTDLPDHDSVAEHMAADHIDDVDGDDSW